MYSGTINKKNETGTAKTDIDFIGGIPESLLPLRVGDWCKDRTGRTVGPLEDSQHDEWTLQGFDHDQNCWLTFRPDGSYGQLPGEEDERDLVVLVGRLYVEGELVYADAINAGVKFVEEGADRETVLKLLGDVEPTEEKPVANRVSADEQVDVDLAMSTVKPEEKPADKPAEQVKEDEPIDQSSSGNEYYDLMSKLQEQWLAQIEAFGLPPKLVSPKPESQPPSPSKKLSFYEFVKKMLYEIGKSMGLDHEELVSLQLKTEMQKSVIEAAEKMPTAQIVATRRFNTCASCHWFYEQAQTIQMRETIGLGMCRKNAPVVHQNRRQWPAVNSKDSCGDFEKRGDCDER